MNTQEIFDKVASHLLTQNQRSRKAYVGCAYRGEGGMQCAVGCLIADEFYDKNLEGDAMDGFFVTRAVTASIGRELSADEVVMLEKLQSIHDRVEPDNWRAWLNGLACRCGLDSSVLKEGV